MKTNTETKHTPGPWHFNAQPAGDPLDLLNSTTGGFGIFSETPHSAIGQVCENGSGEANARLIAAAPELLAALKQSERVLFGYLVTYGHDKTGKLALDQVKAAHEATASAIAKATAQA